MIHYHTLYGTGLLLVIHISRFHKDFELEEHFYEKTKTKSMSYLYGMASDHES